MYVLVRPEIYFKSEGLAVFMFTPTSFTALVTTKSNDDDNFLALTSCWYKPTPILSGVIFTSSDKASWSLLPILIALLSSTTKSGNSFIASGDAL